MRYYKLKKNGSVEFLLIQHDPNTNSYVAKPFNVYLNPRPFGTLGQTAPDVRFACQASSLDFLAAQDFDFNKVFKRGVGHLSLPAYEKLQRDHRTKLMEQKLADKLREKRNSLRSPPNTPQLAASLQQINKLTADQKSFVDAVANRIQDFLEDESAMCLDLDPCNAFQRKLIFQTVTQRFASGIQAESKVNPKQERFVSLTKADPEQQLLLAEQKTKEKEKEMDDALGFTKVVQALAASEKIIVGHNILLDLLHFLHRFVHPGLPDDYDEFKSLLHDTFSKIIDTKVIASTLPFKDLISDHSLGPLRDRLLCSPFKPPTVKLPQEFSRYEHNSAKEECQSGPLHEAGFDAYITGICFATMLDYLASFLDPPPQLFMDDSKILAPYLNKIHLMRCSPDASYMALEGQDPDPPRDHVFYITFPKEWKIHDITTLFRQFGQVYITWIDESSAFVTLKDRAFSAQATKAFCSGIMDPSLNFKLLPFTRYRTSFLSEFERSATLDTRKRSAVEADLPTGNEVDSSPKRAKTEGESLSSRPNYSNVVREPDNYAHSRYSWTKNAMTMAKTKAKEFLAKAMSSSASGCATKDQRIVVSASSSEGEEPPPPGDDGMKLNTKVAESMKLAEMEVVKEEGEVSSDGESEQAKKTGKDRTNDVVRKRGGGTDTEGGKDTEAPEQKKRKTGLAAKNAFKRLSLRRREEKSKSFEAKVKLFEEDDEWT